MPYSLRRATPDDVDFLWAMLFEASYAAENGVPDVAAGAAWWRLLTAETKGYGYVDDATPELAIAVSPGHRGRGLGGRMLRELLDAARASFDAVSLSVRADNPAVRLYERAGFRTVGDDTDTDAGAVAVAEPASLTMTIALRRP